MAHGIGFSGWGPLQAAGERPRGRDPCPAATPEQAQRNALQSGPHYSYQEAWQQREAASWGFLHVLCRGG